MIKESYLLAQIRDWIVEKKGELAREGSVQYDETQVKESGEYSVRKGKVNVSRVEITVEVNVWPTLKNDSDRGTLWNKENGRNTTTELQLLRQGGYPIFGNFTLERIPQRPF